MVSHILVVKRKQKLGGIKSLFWNPIFNNSNMLLRDFNGKKTCSASILIPQRTPLAWISIIEFEQKYYVLHRTDETGTGDIAGE
ncbi:MAG TPA: hypothetical protein VFC89_01320 [Oscillospiraceae bacterium]|nr:hypothetical protein [Oscillospiraceae bacterium]